MNLWITIGERFYSVTNTPSGVVTAPFESNALGIRPLASRLEQWPGACSDPFEAELQHVLQWMVKRQFV